MKNLVRIPNAIWWLQMRLAKGSRMLYVTLIFLAALIGGTMVYRKMEPNLSPVALAAGVIGVVSFLQFIILTLRGAAAIFKAVNRDFTTGMVESHRMSPITGFAMTTGYLFGATAPTTLFFVAALLFGTILLATSSMTPVPWIVGNVMLYATSLMIWSIVVYGGTGKPKPVNPIGILIGLGVAGRFLGPVISGFGILAGAAPGWASYAVMNGHLNTGPANLAAAGSSDFTIPQVSGIILGCLILASFWLWAAARRFRRPDRPAFDALHGSILLLIWLAASVGGPLIYPRDPNSVIDDPAMPHFISTLIVSMMLAIVAINGACADRARLVRGGHPVGWIDRLSSRWVVLFAVVVICEALMLSGSQWEKGNRKFPWMICRANAWQWGYTAAAMLAALLAVDGFLRRNFLKPRRSSGQLGVFVMVIWAGPLAIDLAVSLINAYRAIDEFGNGAGPVVRSWLFGCSPIGTMLSTWSPLRAPLLPGLIVQVVLAAVMTAWGLKAERAEVAGRRSQGLELPGLPSPLARPQSA